MNFDAGKVTSEPPYPRPRDQLAVVELNSTEVVAGDEVVERGVGDEGQVVQLDGGEVLRCARSCSQLPNALVCDQLAVRKTNGFEKRAARSQCRQSCVGDQDAFLQVDALQQVTAPRKSLESCVRQLRHAGALQGGQLGAVVGQGNEGGV